MTFCSVCRCDGSETKALHLQGGIWRCEAHHARHMAEQAIGADLALCDVGLALTKGKVRKQYRDHRAACMAQIRQWNAEDGLARLSDDELMRELGA